MKEKLLGIWKEYGLEDCEVVNEIEFEDVIIFNCEEFNPCGSPLKFTLMYSKDSGKFINSNGDDYERICKWVTEPVK